MKLSLIVCLWLLFMSSCALAQQVDMSSSAIDNFNLLKMLSYVAVGIAAIIGASVFRYMHKRFMQYDHWIGAVFSLVSVILLYLGAKSFALKHNGNTDFCLNNLSTTDEMLDPCVQGREALADILGFKSIYVHFWPKEILEQGGIAPISLNMINFMIYASFIVGTLVAYYLIFKPIAQKI